MRHLRIRHRLGRTTSHRIAMLRNMAASFLRHERIITTLTRSKLLVPYVEHMITKAKVDSVANRRLIAPRIGGDQELLRKLFAAIAPKFATRPGGYTRVIKLGIRPSDATLMVAVELVEKITAPTITEKAVEKEKRTEKKGKVQTTHVRKTSGTPTKPKKETTTTTTRPKKTKAGITTTDTTTERKPKKTKPTKPGGSRKVGEE